MVLTEEGIQEQGTHQELLEQKGVYERLYMMQFVNQEMKIDRNEED